MSCNRVLVEAGSRLHGGFHTLPSASRSWGGLGFYIERPGVLLEAWGCPEGYTVYAPEEYRSPILRGARAALPSGICLRLRRAPPRHAGFGSTTQLTLSAYTAAYTIARGRPPTRRELLEAAARLGRTRYSLVGTLLYTMGGIVVDAGTERGPHAGPLMRASWPMDWLVILVRPRLPRGLSEGVREDRVMEGLPPAPERLLWRASRGLHIFMEGVVSGDVDRALEGLQMIQGVTGAYFSRVQGGIYRGDLERLADEAWRDGIYLAQSSWGPTLYTLTTRDRVHSDLKTLKMISRIVGVEASVEAVEGRDLPALVWCA